ncbi:exported hypothetical protein [[Clostridium] ultunense Esp]|uniref:SipW-dependent-type signal peptide-containing protein n=1 Tax=Thermicanus aegyptius TaxID=94009 RepID=UPI0002B700C8|nr:SipW-dependent-type signal peptide-containing protein [Thermicanus aegyptius]CCQ96161.1 exported hypothetical protein [[Clostridium] ultunense Esp]
MSKRKLATFALSLMLVLTLAVGAGTFALFTSSVSSEGNHFTAGTIDLDEKRDHGDYVPGPMFYPDFLDPDGNHPYDVQDIAPSGESIGGWAPGDTVQRTMILMNKGTLDAKVTGIKATPREEYTQHLRSGGSRTVNGLTSGPAYEEFIEKAHVLVSVPDQNLQLYDGSLADLIRSEGYHPVQNELILQGATPPLEPGPLNITFKVALDSSASNQLQGQNFIFDFSFFAEQARNNGGNDGENGGGDDEGPVIEKNEEVTIFVTWKNYGNFDSHLTGPTGNGGRFHVYYEDKRYADNNVKAQLVENDGGRANDREKTKFTIKNSLDGTYRFSVHDYGNRRFTYATKLATSETKVEVYQKGRLLASYDVPNGDGTLWTVFEMNHGRITPVNTMSYEREPGKIQ